MGLEQKIDLRLPDQDHLDAQRNRFGLERHRVGQAQHFFQRLNPEFAGLERTLEAVPGEAVAQQLECVDHEVTAVGAMQRARLDQREIGHQRTHLRMIFDPPGQVLVSRVILEDDRRAIGVGVIDDHVDAVLEKLADPAGDIVRVRGALARQEVLGVLDRVFFHGREIGQDVGLLTVALLDPGHQLFHRVQGDFLVQRLDPLMVLALQQGHVTDDVLQLQLEFRDQLFDTLFLGVRQFFELRLIQRSTVDRWPQRVPRRRPHDHDPFRPRLRVEFAKGLFLPILELLLDLLAPVAVFLAFERTGQRGQEVLDQLFHVLAQLLTEARG